MCEPDEAIYNMMQLRPRHGPDSPEMLGRSIFHALSYIGVLETPSRYVYDAYKYMHVNIIL